MRASERKLYEQESEIRPNHYAALALTVLSWFIIGMMLANELGIFKENVNRMRFASFASLIILEIPLFVTGTGKGLRDPRTKYLLIGCMGLVTLIVCTVLSFHATLILMLPVLLASQYPSGKMCRVAVMCSIACALVSPVFSYLFGTWDTEFVSWLCRVVKLDVVEALAPDSRGTTLVKILIYLSVPHALIILACSPLASSIGHGGELRLKNQVQVLHMSESDALTGLLNRTKFEIDIVSGAQEGRGNVAVVYVDANGLHRINNEAGHSEGDRLLICVADSMRDAFGTENVYRIGGDEFVALLQGPKLSEVQASVTQVRARVEQHGYSIAVGIEYAQPPCTLPALVAAAETKMQIDKSRYHIER